MADGVGGESAERSADNPEEELTQPERAAAAAAGLVRARAERDKLVNGNVGGYHGVAETQNKHVAALITQADRILAGELDEATLLAGIDERDRSFVVMYLKRMRNQQDKPKRGRSSDR
jgi:hypothetical protein